MELQPDDGPRSSLSIEPRFRRCSGISLEFVRRFAEGIGKLTGNMLGDCQKKTIGLVARILEVARLAGREPLFAKISIGKPSVSGGCTITTQIFKRLIATDPLRLGS
ncbi:hypothetical protein GW17_00045430 [Ensete ventricosum]|nr:hypothetical protein GW17_00045430 [Ensete ventricosum]